MNTCRILAAFAVLALTACDDIFEASSARAYTSVATGGEHTCAVDEDGAAWCWGRGAEGQLGNRESGERFAPARVRGELTFSQVTAGDNHTCALTAEGRAWCWGWNVFYQRGNATDGDGTEPVSVETEVRFTSISAGAHHTCGIGVDSLAYCWGANQYGQGGDSANSTIIWPKRVRGNSRFTQIAAGAWHTCALTPAGVAWCWGRNDTGQLGIDSTQVFRNIPTRVAGSVTFASIDGGASHTCAVARDQRLFCWGSNQYGELGNGGAFVEGLPGALVPQPVSPQLPAGSSISAGVYHTCAIGPDRRGSCWGFGGWGQLANGALRDHYQPQPVHLQPQQQHTGDLLNFQAFATGGKTHACGLVDKSVYCWGTGKSGQLGVIGSTFAPLPQRVAD